MLRGAAGFALIALAALAAGGCQGREVREGKALFAQYCASCHGQGGIGQNAERPFGGIDPSVGILAPALDSAGHCWYHPPGELFRLIKQGTGLEGSSMPAWGGRLSDTQIQALIAYIQSLWTRDIRRRYRLLQDS